MSIDQGKPTIPVLLDLSAAFDTLDHNVLLFRLKNMFDLSGKVLKWLRSYLEHCSQRVSVHGILSDIQFLLYGVPQDSIIDSLVFTINTVLLESLRSDMGLHITCMLMIHSCIYITGS